MRFRPAYISVINRRASFPFVIGTAVVRENAPGSPAGTCSLRAAPIEVVPGARTVLAGKGSLRRARHRRALARSAPFCRSAFSRRAASMRGLPCVNENSVFSSPDKNRRLPTNGRHRGKARLFSSQREAVFFIR